MYRIIKKHPTGCFFIAYCFDCSQWQLKLQCQTRMALSGCLDGLFQSGFRTIYGYLFFGTSHSGINKFFTQQSCMTIIKSNGHMIKLRPLRFVNSHRIGCGDHLFIEKIDGYPLLLVFKKHFESTTLITSLQTKPNIAIK